MGRQRMFTVKCVGFLSRRVSSTLMIEIVNISDMYS